MSNNLFHYTDDQQTDIYFDAKTNETYKFTKKQFYLAVKIRKEEILKFKQVLKIGGIVFIGEDVYVKDNAIIINSKAHYLVYQLHKHYILEYETGSLSLVNSLHNYIVEYTREGDRLCFNKLWIPVYLKNGHYRIYLIENIYILWQFDNESNNSTCIEVFPNNIAAPMHTKAAIHSAGAREY